MCLIVQYGSWSCPYKVLKYPFGFKDEDCDAFCKSCTMPSDGCVCGECIYGQTKWSDDKGTGLGCRSGYKDWPDGASCPVNELVYDMECTRSKVVTPVTCKDKVPLPDCCYTPPPPPSPPPDPPTNCNTGGDDGNPSFPDPIGM